MLPASAAIPGMRVLRCWLGRPIWVAGITGTEEGGYEVHPVCLHCGTEWGSHHRRLT